MDAFTFQSPDYGQMWSNGRPANGASRFTKNSHDVILSRVHKRCASLPVRPDLNWLGWLIQLKSFVLEIYLK